MQKAVQTITVNDVDFIVEYGYTEYRPATQYDPPEMPEVEIIAVMLDGNDVTELLSEWTINQIFDKIEAPTKQDRLAELGEMQYEQMRERHFFKD